MADLNTNLIVRGESVQSLYSQFRAGQLLVNRRYQRKLVWSVEEKQSFIDSLMTQLPVPLILVAERQSEAGRRLEIIDGLQRLNAVFSFIENAFPVSDGYFDLDTLAETKALADSQELAQRSPRLRRDECTKLAGYNLPLSVYRAGSDSEVDEIFRRINSGGRHLSRQDLRQAGSTSHFAALVRKVAASVRGDYSVGDIVDLRDMPKISISSSPNGPGLFVDNIPWVKQRILGRDQVRESRDEEVVADLLMSMLIDPMPPYDSRVLDQYYGFATDDDDRRARIDAVIQSQAPERVYARFQRVLEAFLQIFEPKSSIFAAHVFSDARQRVPRYFEAVFLGLHILIIDEHLELSDVTGAREALRGVGSKHIDIPAGGGTWVAGSKSRNAEVVAGLLRKHMRPASAGSDPSTERTAHEVRNLLTAATVEFSLVEFKQGFTELADTPTLSAATLKEVARTLSAMANHGPDSKGYVIVGIADTLRDAQRVESLGGEPVLDYSGKFITGVGLDVRQVGSLDELMLWLSSQMQAIEMDEELRSQVLGDVRPVVFEGRPLLFFTVRSGSGPVAFENRFYERQGSQTLEVPGRQVSRLFSRFSPRTTVH